MDHSRTIVHIDLDCFYAQVEELKNTELKTLPFGVQQQNFVITSNYIAREYGIKKCMLISEAKKLCPNLILVRGEDLHDYRQISYKVTSLLQKYSHLVERLGLDENFIDVSKLVSERLQNGAEISIVGNIFGDISSLCDCGCSDRLKVGTEIAQDMREQIKNELNLTCCAGIAHNKLLAKLIGSKHKPDNQTVIFPNSAVELMLSLNNLSKIPSIGLALGKQLSNMNIKSVSDLQESDFLKIKKLLGPEKAKTVYDLSFGIDPSPVKSSGKPQSIGIEDACKSISAEKEVKEKLKQLLNRLLILVAEDGRIPKTVKLTVRKFDKNNKVSTRETRQCNINTSLFDIKSLSKLSESNENKLMTTIMRLFTKIVKTDKPYLITLLGLAFTKFLEKPNEKNSTLTNFLIKDIEVQSVTNIENLTFSNTTPDILPSTSYVENPEAEPEPSPKKCKFSNLIAKKRFFKEQDDCASPSKLKVAELRLNSTEKPTDTNQNICCPPNANKEVFQELPKDIQQELWEEYKQSRDTDRACSSNLKKSKPNSILNYLVKH
ncbi:DNA polymerase iota [Anoplophora glabripennis]|uniref:DNA polymerase iota n=1 Tax=Anoplophora glabripennis TaxID=217634 RepID=UPI0008751FA2|nr:DNA polymerase iota [Anoplophora glabripennis]